MEMVALLAPKRQSLRTFWRSERIASITTMAATRSSMCIRSWFIDFATVLLGKAWKGHSLTCWHSTQKTHLIDACVILRWLVCEATFFSFIQNYSNIHDYSFWEGCLIQYDLHGCEGLQSYCQNRYVGTLVGTIYGSIYGRPHPSNYPASTCHDKIWNDMISSWYHI